MSDYTPSTAQVKATWCADERYGGPSRAELSAEFDRWLADHDASIASEAAERALREAATDMRSDKYPGHWNLRVNGDPDHSASPDAWLEYRADRLRAEREAER